MVQCPRLRRGEVNAGRAFPERTFPTASIASDNKTYLQARELGTEYIDRSRNLVVADSNWYLPALSFPIAPNIAVSASSLNMQINAVSHSNSCMLEHVAARPRPYHMSIIYPGIGPRWKFLDTQHSLYQSSNIR